MERKFEFFVATDGREVVYAYGPHPLVVFLKEGSYQLVTSRRPLTRENHSEVPVVINCDWARLSRETDTVLLDDVPLTRHDGTFDPSQMPPCDPEIVNLAVDPTTRTIYCLVIDQDVLLEEGAFRLFIIKDDQTEWYWLTEKNQHRGSGSSFGTVAGRLVTTSIDDDRIFWNDTELVRLAAEDYEVTMTMLGDFTLTKVK